MNAPTSRTLSDQLRRLLVLTAPEAPIEKRPPFSVGAGMREAIEAARVGDMKTVDEIEVAWRNLLGPRPEISDEDEAAGLFPIARKILHNFGPCGEMAIEWMITQPCPRCFRRWTIRATCHRCSGYGHMGDEWGVVVIYTRLDSTIIEEVWP